jgi:HlyD family secretion protein
VARAQAQADDLAKGRRREEIDALNASRDAAQAALQQSEAEYRRQLQLAKEGFVSDASLDTLKARRDADAARLHEAQAQLHVARLGGRSDQRAAALADTQAAQAGLAGSRWQLAQKAVAAVNAARVEDTLFRVGEWVPAGSPVVNLLEPDGVKVRFFVEQARLGALKLGDSVSVLCDGCPQPVPAKVSFIANQVEYTPPVIYSREQRSKLVFLVEARPAAADAARLHPGQPVEVRLTGGAS